MFLSCFRLPRDYATLCFWRFLKTDLSIFYENPSIYTLPIHDQKYELSLEVNVELLKIQPILHDEHCRKGLQTLLGDPNRNDPRAKVVESSTCYENFPMKIYIFDYG